MKFVLFNEYIPGILKDEQVYDISAVLDPLNAHSPQEMVQMTIADWARLHPLIEEHIADQSGVALDAVRLRPPVPRPGQLVCLAGNYLDRSPERSPFNAFIKSSNSVIGLGDTVILPPVEASVFHIEPEIAIVIGKPASHLSLDQAMACVFGYTQFLDVSARNLPGKGFFLGKSWHTFGPMGPVIVTADEIEKPNELGVKLWVNDEEWHNFSTSSMDRHVAELLVEVTKVLALEPGDVVSTGTHHLGLKPLHDGDVVRLSIEQMGLELSVNISDPSQRSWA